jgi:hypothetical protein
MPVRGVRRRAPATRASGLLLLVVLVMAQPQVLCGLHCMLFAGSMPVGAPTGQHGDHAPGALCHGHTMTGRQTIPVARLATAWLPGVRARGLVAPVHAFRLPDPRPPRLPPFPDPESPPPRG